MSISGCSSNLVVRTEVPVFPPEALLVSPCKPMNLFETPRQQGESQIHNYTCIEKYEASFESLRQWKIEKQSLYNKQSEK